MGLHFGGDESRFQRKLPGRGEIPVLLYSVFVCAYSFDDPVPNILCAGQCEYSFSKTHVIMEMNKKEMERYEEVYGYVLWEEGVESGWSPSWITSVYYVIEYYRSLKSVGFRNTKGLGL